MPGAGDCAQRADPDATTALSVAGMRTGILGDAGSFIREL